MTERDPIDPQQSDVNGQGDRRAVVEVQGGLVQAVWTDPGVVVTVVDWDALEDSGGGGKPSVAKWTGDLLDLMSEETKKAIALPEGKPTDRDRQAALRRRFELLLGMLQGVAMDVRDDDPDLAAGLRDAADLVHAQIQDAGESSGADRTELEQSTRE